jgi:hypothetical protein
MYVLYKMLHTSPLTSKEVQFPGDSPPPPQPSSEEDILEHKISYFSICGAVVSTPGSGSEALRRYGCEHIESTRVLT